MWRINGQGDNQVKLLDVCRPVVLHCAISGGTRPHPVTGRHLHAVYVIDTGKLRPAVVNLGGDERDRSMKVEFDLNGQIHLNLAGTLYMAGGSPEVSYEISMSWTDAGAPIPSWHPLTTLVTGGLFVVPAYHSRVRSTGVGVRYSVGGNVGVLDHLPIHVTGDTRMVINDGPPPVVNLTGNSLAGGGLAGLAPESVTLISDWWG